MEEMIITDEQLIEVYMKGFIDSLHDMHPQPFETSLEQKAYQLGRIDALIGDEIEAHDYQTNEEILSQIRGQR
jgi:hypothetical protein